MPLPIVHAVTTPEILLDADFVRRATGVMEALRVRGAVHLRGHRLSAHELLDCARALFPLQERTGCWLVVNDRVDVALAAGARGAQLTSRSMTVADARRVAPELPLGASVHSATEARAAAAQGAHWLVAGHVFETSSHPGEAGRGVAFLRAVSELSAVPVVAIGGITPGDVPSLLAAGAHGVAVIRGVWGSIHADRAAIDYLSTYDAYRGSGGHDCPHGEW